MMHLYRNGRILRIGMEHGIILSLPEPHSIDKTKEQEKIQTYITDDINMYIVNLPFKK